MPIPSKYEHIEIEKKWYSYWIKNNLFKSIPKYEIEIEIIN